MFYEKPFLLSLLSLHSVGEDLKRERWPLLTSQLPSLPPPSPICGDEKGESIDYQEASSLPTQPPVLPWQPGPWIWVVVICSLCRDFQDNTWFSSLHFIRAGHHFKPLPPQKGMTLCPTPLGACSSLTIRRDQIAWQVTACMKTMARNVALDVVNNSVTVPWAFLIV